MSSQSIAEAHPTAIVPTQRMRRQSRIQGKSIVTWAPYGVACCQLWGSMGWQLGRLRMVTEIRGGGGDDRVVPAFFLASTPLAYSSSRLI